jgi:hypothetical protein
MSFCRTCSTQALRKGTGMKCVAPLAAQPPGKTELGVQPHKHPASPARQGRRRRNPRDWLARREAWQGFSTEAATHAPSLAAGHHAGLRRHHEGRGVRDAVRRCLLPDVPLRRCCSTWAACAARTLITNDDKAMLCVMCVCLGMRDTS